MACDNRRLRILELIKKYSIGKQEQLVDLLNEEGYNVTQATVSRDINELGLKKVKENGSFRYVQTVRSDSFDADKISTMYKQTVHSVVASGNLIIIKTLPGSANAVCAVIDGFELNGIYGSIAGDDCIFLAADPGVAQDIAARLTSYLTSDSSVLRK